VPQVVVAALLRGGGEVLLCYRSAQRLAYPAVWDFPGGHVEAGETPLQTLRREVLEEVGVSVHTETLTETPDLRVTTGELDLSMWAVRAWEGEPMNCAPEEHDEVGWYDIGDAITKRLGQPAYRPWLATLLE
jgi:mutator protein MutT